MTESQCLATLGLPPGAGPDEVKRAYRRQALRCHPDRHADDPLAEEKFKKVSRAYLRLTAAGPFDPPPPSRPAETGFDQTDLADIIYFFTTRPRLEDLFDQLSEEFASLGIRFNRQFLVSLFGPDRVFTGRVLLHRPLWERQPHWVPQPDPPTLFRTLLESVRRPSSPPAALWPLDLEP